MLIEDQQDFLLISSDDYQTGKTKWGPRENLMLSTLDCLVKVVVFRRLSKKGLASLEAALSIDRRRTKIYIGMLMLNPRTKCALTANACI